MSDGKFAPFSRVQCEHSQALQSPSSFWLIIVPQGCCQSTPRDEERDSPYSTANAHGNSSSRAITAEAPQLQQPTSPRGSESQGQNIGHRSSNRRQLALGEQFNAPLRPHVWTSKRPWTRSALERERTEFFETRVTGHAEIWATLKIVVGLLQNGDLPTAQSILDAAAITLPTGDLKNGAYDEAGNLYQLPEHIVSDPTNMTLDQPRDDMKGETPMDGTDDEELERLREEKGKSVVKDLIKVKARLSDRGGPDVIVSVGREQAVRTLVRRIAEEANMAGKSKIRIAYMGKILKDGESLETQGWREGHVVNALVFQ